MSGSTSASYASRPKRRETKPGDRLVLARGSRRHVRLGREPCLRRGREELARLERLETRRDHPGQALGERVQLVATAHEAAAVLGSTGDQLVAEAELLAQSDAALLPREEAVRRRLDDEAVDALGADLPAEHVVLLDEDDMRLGSERLEPARRGQPGDPAADHDDDGHAESAAPSRNGAARSRTSSASAPMKRGSSLRAGRPFEPHSEACGDSRCLPVDVEEDLDVIRDEADRHRHDVPHPLGGERRQVLAEIRPCPRLRASGPPTGTPTTSARRADPRAARRGSPSRGTARRTDHPTRARAGGGCVR